MENQALDIIMQENLQVIAKLRLLDDDFMSKVFEDTECAEFLLQIILNRDDLKALFVKLDVSKTLYFCCYTSSCFD